MTKLRRLVQEIVNSHCAQTGLPTVAGEQVLELAVDILEDSEEGLSDQDYALLEAMTQGELRAGPIPVQDD